MVDRGDGDRAPIRISDIAEHIADRVDVDSPTVSIGLIASVNLGPFGLLARRHAANSGVNLRVVEGSYDNPIEDAARHAESEVDFALLVPYLDAHTPFLSGRIDAMSDDERETTIASFVSRWSESASILPPSTRVVCCLPHATWSNTTVGEGTPRARWVDELNDRLITSIRDRRSASFIDLSSLISKLGESRSIDTRLMYRAKSPYSIDLLDELAWTLWLHSLEFGSRYPKVLVLDCDNTLWGGVLGEEGSQGVALDPFDHPGNVFWTIQHRIKRLKRQGVLLCLATKNEPGDVLGMLDEHPSMVLRREDFAAMRIGWTSKPEMLAEMAEELSLGLDSFVFLDDSPFECESVRTRLPRVVVHQVPASVSDYPDAFRSIEVRFTPVLDPVEGSSRTDRYLERRATTIHESTFGTQEEFLESLDLRVRLVDNEIERVKRLSELTLKTNQFNLTGERLTTDEIAESIRAGLVQAWSCHVIDRFTDHGLTGLVLVSRDADTATISNMVLSCRVLGRGVEWAMIHAVCSELFANGARVVRASRVALPRNDQTSDFLEKSGFRTTGGDGVHTHYELSGVERLVASPGWISVSFDGR